jgi:hypothetical protein
MATTHDDLPHPIPPLAHLRWKENWFFIAMDPAHGVHGVVHFNFEPAFDRARYSCHLSVRGKRYQYLNETSFPEDFAFSRVVGCAEMKLRFGGPPACFELGIKGEDFELELAFEKGRPVFDFATCRSASPGVPSFQEVMTLGTNLPYNHQQQAMLTRGSVRILGTGEREVVPISGYGYRDHSWCMRADSGVANHIWCALHFGERAFGIKKIHTRARPEVWAREGYVSDNRGERALKHIDIAFEGKSDEELPERVRFNLTDVFGESFTLVCDVAGRYAQVPLVSEKPGKGGTYSITENFCPTILEETGEKGCALVEIGRAVG